MVAPPKPLKRGLDGMGSVPGGDPETHVIALGQRGQQVGRASERDFRADRVTTKHRHDAPICRDHLLDRRVRSGQLGENKFQRHSNQCKTLGLGWQRKSELTEYEPVRFDDKFAAIDEGSIEIENDKLHCNRPGASRPPL